MVYTEELYFPLPESPGGFRSPTLFHGAGDGIESHSTMMTSRTAAITHITEPLGNVTRFVDHDAMGIPSP